MGTVTFDRKPRLSAREYQVCDLLMQAMNNRDMARELGIQLRTVKGILSRLFVKFNIEDDPTKHRRVVLAVKLYKAKWGE